MAFGQDADRHALLGIGAAGGGLAVALAGGGTWPVGAALVPLGLAWAGLLGHVAPLALVVVAPVAVPLHLWRRLRRRHRVAEPGAAADTGGRTGSCEYPVTRGPRCR